MGTQRRTQKRKSPAPAAEPDLAVVAQAAAAWFDRHGTLPAWWNNRRVTGAMIQAGLATHEALRKAGCLVPALAGRGDRA